MEIYLNSRQTLGAQVSKTFSGWRLQIPTGVAGSYRLAQLDNYSSLSRKKFPIRIPGEFSLKCRASSTNIAGTWGFGFWNDPFAISAGVQGTGKRLPVLPNAGWFFHASPENHLSFQNHLAGSGFLAQTFRSPKIPHLLLAPGILALPLLFNKHFSKWLRAFTGKIVNEDSQRLDLDVTEWHQYDLAWRSESFIFRVDDRLVLETPVSPQEPLGVVIWIDNQYAAWNPDGKVAMGSLQQNCDSWLEIEQIQFKSRHA